MRKKLLRSRSGFEKPESREEAIMQNILGASNVLEPSESNIEEILKSILYNTPYTKEAEFEIEKILLAIKNNGTYDGEGESRDMKILIAILRESSYTEETESRIEELFVEWLQQRQQIKVLEGVPPLIFPSRGLPLINYLIEGNTVQNGTPTPSSPIQPSECGDLETSGTKAGQYKIPILSANTTTPIYLGEVETTRKIKKLVLTGEENNWGEYARADSSTVPYLPLSDFKGASKTNVYADIICTHYDKKSQVNIQNLTNRTGIAGRTSIGIIIADETKSTLADFKTYLQQQYANGTPVTVWYVLATEEAAVVNEPLMKIGDYADTLSKAQAGVQIPTNNGSTTIDVDTTLKPSNVYIEYK